MTNNMIHVANDFWNIRGSYKIAGVVDLGTQASLVRLASGKFVLLDAYTLSAEVKQEIDALTHGGSDLEAILNVHPFHTLHVARMHETYPHAKLYGTARHLLRFPDLPWADICTEDPRLHQLYTEDLAFSVPRGVDFISDNENVHFSSVLVLHRASMTIHSDDTLTYLRLPGLARALGLGDSVSFHPTLSKALQKRAGAAAEFRNWAEELMDRWQDADNLCAAHTAALLARENRGASIHARLLRAFRKVEGTLQAHQDKYG